MTCRQCRWHDTGEKALKTQHPFIDGELILACPNCKSIYSLVAACDELGCWQEAVCGTPVTGGGYRITCGRHAPEREDVE